MNLIPKHWASFQHYKGRRPPWIKLHRTLLDDYEFARLHVASRALAPCLWLLASEYNDGCIKASAEEIAFRLRMNVKDFQSALTPLIEKGFFSDASNTLATCKQDAILETETDTETEGEYKRETKNDRSNRDDGFETFYATYPRHVGKKDAEKAYRKAIREIAPDKLLAALETQKPRWTDPKYIPHPATWLNGGRWSDETAQPRPAETPLERKQREHSEFLQSLNCVNR